MQTLILNTGETAKYLDEAMAIETLDTLFRELGTGRVVAPPKINTDMSDIGHEAWCNAMPAYLMNAKVGGIKWIGGFGENHRQNLPYIMGLIVLTDPRNGHVKSVMDAQVVSTFRTGASAAVFARYLTYPDLKNILVVGAGVQGRTAVRCLHHEFPEARIYLNDLRSEQVESFRRSVSGSLADKLLSCNDLARTAPDCGLIVLLTTASRPFFKNDWIAPGTTVLGMGSYQQIEDAFALTCDKIVSDAFAQATHRGEIMPLCESGQLGEADFYAELSNIVLGEKPGRQNKSERILGLPIGMGAYDVAIADKVFKAAQKNNDGTLITIQEV